jgi:hypothetical protein
MMFYKKNETGYRAVMDWIRLKTLVHDERTLLCELRIEKGKVLPSHKHHHKQTGYLVSGRMRYKELIAMCSHERANISKPSILFHISYPHQNMEAWRLFKAITSENPGTVP